MTTVLPPPPPTPPPSGGVPNAATLVTPSSEVAALARGANIEGVVQAVLGKNQIQVQTVLGTLTLQTTTNVPVNSVISLVLSQLQPQQVLQITSLNGVPLSGNNTGASANPLNATTTGAAAPASTQTVAPGTQASATLLRPASGTIQTSPGGQTPTTQTATPAMGPAAGTAAQTTAQAAATSTGTASPTSPAPGQTHGQAAGAKIAMGLAAGSAAGQPATGSAATGTPSSANAPTSAGTLAQPAPATTATGAATGNIQTGTNAKAGNVTIPSGTRFNVNVVKIDTPTSTPVVQSAPSSGAGPATNTATNTGAVLTLARGVVMTGTVTGQTASGQPIIQLPSATIALDVQGKLVVGSKITIEVTANAQVPKQTTAANALIQAGGHETFIKSNSWGSLNEALRAIELADPGRFNQIIQNVIPQVGSKLSSQILFFISALRSGDVRSWLGEAPVRLIERERPGLLSRIGSEFQAMGKLADDPSGGDWRMAMIPIYHGERVDRIRLYQRNARDKNEDSDDGKRFVLDFDLSKLGHIQIDGLVKSDSSKVDIIIRTEKSLGQKAQMEIAQIYNEAAELTGIGGGIAFQSSPGNFVEFPSATENTDHDGLIV